MNNREYCREGRCLRSSFTNVRVFAKYFTKPLSKVQWLHNNGPPFSPGFIYGCIQVLHAVLYLPLIRKLLRGKKIKCSKTFALKQVSSVTFATCLESGFHTKVNFATRKHIWRRALVIFKVKHLHLQIWRWFMNGRTVAVEQEQQTVNGYWKEV